MGKRSAFLRNERDYYITPLAAVEPLLPHLEQEFEFVEICAGNGALIDHLEKNGGKCVLKTDIEPQRSDIQKMDMFDLNSIPAIPILNPPWDRKILHPLIEFLLEKTDSFWLLFDADWMHTKQSSQYIGHCKKIVSVGRVKWIPDSKMTGKDNCCWYYFTKEPVDHTEFYGR